MEKMGECQRVVQVLEGEWEAMQAQLAAGQAWADAHRASQEALGDGTFSRRHILTEADARDAFMAAFPAGGAR